MYMYLPHVDGSILCVCVVVYCQAVATSRSDAYASLTGRARQLAMEEFKAEMGGTWQAAGGQLQQPQQVAAEGDGADNESESSMPCSLPSDIEAPKNQR